jgi:MFS family permease
MEEVLVSAMLTSPFSLYFLSAPFLGPVAGPIISGFINEHLDWRWTWWVTIMCVDSLLAAPLCSADADSLPVLPLNSWAAVELLLIFLLVPETYLPAKLLTKAKKLRKAGRGDVKAPMELDQRSVPKVIVTSCTKPFGKLRCAEEE